MKIAILGIRGIPAHYGGFETNVQITARELVNRGHSVVVYCRGGRNGRPKIWEGVRLRYLPSIESRNLSTISHTAISVFSCIFHRCDVVHLYNVGNSFLIPFLKIFGKKVIVSVDGVEWRRKKFGVIGSTWMHLSEKLATWFAHAIVVDSLKVGEYYRNQYNAETVYIPYGSYISECECPSGILEKFGLEKGKYLLFVGRFIPEKGIDKLLSAYSNIRTDMPLVIVGDNPYDFEYVNRLKSQAPPGTVFTGAIYGESMAELYANSYLFVSPSELEGTSPALLEAMGAGTCVIVNGIPEQLETISDAGIYYKVNDLRDLTRKIQNLIDHPKIRNEFAKKAKKRVEKYYRWESVLDYYENLLANTAGVKLPSRRKSDKLSPKDAVRREKTATSDAI
ncbi:glycosyltransferase [bacterium]|nr:glycosyltransferase [bacterium]